MVGPVVAAAADSEAARTGEHDYSPTANLMEAAAWQLDYYGGLIADEAAVLSNFCKRMSRDLIALTDAIDLHRRSKLAG